MGIQHGTIEEKIEYYKERNLLVHNVPYRIKIESSLGCNRDCKFCGMTRKHSEFMTKKTHDHIVSIMPSTVKRIEYILHGEPTLNPNFIYFVKSMREAHPEIQMALSTNGYRILTKEKNAGYLLELFESGINILQLVIYDVHDLKVAQEIVYKDKFDFIGNGINVKGLYSSHDNLYKFRGSKAKELLFVNETKGQNSGGTASSQRRFHTFGGNIPVEYWAEFSTRATFENLPFTTSCTPLLKYISVRSNGDLLLCCRDAASTIVLDNVMREGFTFEEFWTSKKVDAFRKILKTGHKELIAPCILCSRICYRDPLYPYWGHNMTKEEAIEIVEEHTKIKDDVLLDNLNRFMKVHPEKIVPHIKKEIEEANKLYAKN